MGQNVERRAVSLIKLKLRCVTLCHMVPVQCHVSIHDIVDVLDISCRFVCESIYWGRSLLREHFTERALGIELGFNEHADKL